MTLQEMLTEVVRHNDTKADFITDTKENLAMVPMPGFENEVAIVLNRPESSELERFAITENFHNQVASRLKIPSKFYHRLLQDHRDLLLQNVNSLFDREPEIRMVRTLDGKARAFLSRQFRRVDNEQVLEATLPVIRGDFNTKILNTWVDENRMKFKCLFEGDDHKVDLGTTPNGKQDIVHAGFEMGNSEVGKGSFYIRGFFYRGYCLNGCVFGSEEVATYKQIHVGSKLGVDSGMLLSQETMRKEDELIISAAKDVLTNLSSPVFTQKLGDKLRTLKGRQTVRDAHLAVEAISKELRLSEVESKGVLESFIKDQDYSQWGMVNAVTAQANSTESYARASKIEEMGNNIINLPANRWTRIASLEAIAA
jgi:hypothetical protein